MARTRDPGLLFFPLDVDFLQNIKIKMLKVRYGIDGVMFYIYLLCLIYRKGYYLAWNEDAEYIAADELGMSAEKVRQIMEYLYSRSLLVKLKEELEEPSKLATPVTIITSSGIQKQYQEAIQSKARKTPIEIKKYWLLSENETAPWLKVSLNAKFSGKNKDNSGKNKDNSGNYAIKEKKRKEKKREEKNIYSSEPFQASEQEVKPPEEKSFFDLPLNDGTLWSVTEKQFNEWCELFPAVEVEQELRKMYAWLDANPQRRKTARGIKSFCVSWLSRQQDGGGRFRASAYRPEKKEKSIYEKIQEM